MKTTNINIRITETEKATLMNEAKKLDMNLSEFIMRTVNERVQTDYLTESQEQFARTFEIIFRQVYEPFFKRQMLVLNKLNFNAKWMIRIFNLLLKHVKIPQDKSDILTSFVDHPMLDIASDEVFKEIRSNKQKQVIEDEY